MRAATSGGRSWFAMPMLLTLCLLPLMTLQAEESRRALLIGNADYRYAPLKNPINDIRDLGGELQKLGFSVQRLENPSYSNSIDAIDSFYQQVAADGDGVSLFYYAGHAVQLDNVNYLVPTDAEIKSQQSLTRQSVSIRQLLTAMQQTRNRKNLIILDACRNNPFKTDIDAPLDSRGLPSESGDLQALNAGLAPIEAPAGTIIAYATEPGSVAKDGGGRNGTYTKFLLEHLAKHVTVEEVFKRVRQDVVAATGGQQIPWEHSSLYKTVYFHPPRNQAIPEIGGF